MAVHAKRHWVMVLLALLVAGGIAYAPAHTAWARQDLRPAVASDPGDGVLGDPRDGFGGDPGNGFDGDSNDGSDAAPAGVSGGAVRSGDPRTADDRSDGHDGSSGVGQRFNMARLLLEIISMMTW